MNTQERLAYCRKCKNRTFSMQEGLLCSLTGSKPAFLDVCEHFVNDPEEAAKLEAADRRFSVQNMASQGQRFVNYIIDRIILYVLTVLVVVLFILSGDVESESNGIFYLISFMVALFYYALFETITGQSVGKMITKTVVVTMEGRKPSFGNILGRTLCRFIPFEAFSFLGSPGTGWHDTISKTRVIPKSLMNKGDENMEVLDSGLL